jgi:hypothetical protein
MRFEHSPTQTSKLNYRGVGFAVIPAGAAHSVMVVVKASVLGSAHIMRHCGPTSVVERTQPRQSIVCVAVCCIEATQQLRFAVIVEVHAMAGPCAKMAAMKKLMIVR